MVVLNYKLICITMAKTHQGIRGPKGWFIPNTANNRKNPVNTVEKVPNPGRGDTGR